MRTELSCPELKQIQLDILLAVHRFCQERGLTYSLACGTLLGAIRHQGYIPWDDDIDIYLRRPDYNRLLADFPDVYDGHFRLYALERDRRYLRPYARICDDHTIEIVHDNLGMKGLGVGIDIFPIDEVPDDEAAWHQYNARRRRLYRLYMKKTWIGWHHHAPLWRNLAAVVLKGLLAPITFRYLVHRIDRMAQQHNGKGYHYLFETSMGLIAKDRFLASAFDATIDVPFEGHRLKAMQGYDHYLSQIYGNYMQLPPEEKRVSHHHFTAYKKTEAE